MDTAYVTFFLLCESLHHRLLPYLSRLPVATFLVPVLRSLADVVQSGAGGPRRVQLGLAAESLAVTILGSAAAFDTLVRQFTKKVAGNVAGNVGSAANESVPALYSSDLLRRVAIISMARTLKIRGALDMQADNWKEFLVTLDRNEKCTWSDDVINFFPAPIKEYVLFIYK